MVRVVNKNLQPCEKITDSVLGDDAAVIPAHRAHDPDGRIRFPLLDVADVEDDQAVARTGLRPETSDHGLIGEVTVLAELEVMVNRVPSDA